MATFMDNLGANPSGSGIYGQPKEDSEGDMLSVVNKLKDREMQDFQTKANFMSDLSLRQEARMRSLYDPSKAANAPKDVAPAQVMTNPNQMTEAQKSELG